MLIDFHVNVYDEPGYGEGLAETAKNLGFDRLCIGGGEPCYGLAANAEVRHQADAYPELFVPFARLELGVDGPAVVERLWRIGFAGLRVWAPPAPYCDAAFLAVYEAAEALDMPILFHTGFMPSTRLDRAKRTCCEYMRPVYLDAVARWFPRLSVVGVGLGHPWCEEAAETMRRNHNVYFDLSGDLLRRRGPEFLRALFSSGRASPWESESGANLLEAVVFGSAGRHEDVAGAERDYQRALRSLAADAEKVAAVMGETAARLLDITRAETDKKGD